MGELAAAAADAYGAYQGGLGSPSNQASIGAAVAAGVATIASSGRWGPFPQGLGIGVAPATSGTQLSINIGNLQNPNATPAEKVAASLGIIGGAAGTLAGLMPPAAVLTPQGAAAKAALTGIAIAASAAQLGIQQNLGTVNELINDLVRNWNSLLNDLGDFFGDLFTRAKRWTWPRDPILLDLDGDGLETVGLASNIYFDFDGDGVLTITGWARRTCWRPNRGRQQQRDYQQRRAARHQDAKFGDGKKPCRLGKADGGRAAIVRIWRGR
jgi:hypothetical protein